MQAPDDIRPAPRRTPSAVLWLMAIVVLGGSGLLVFASGPTPSTTLAATSKPPAPTTVDRTPAQHAGPAPDPTPAVSSLQVP